MAQLSFTLLLLLTLCMESWTQSNVCFKRMKRRAGACRGVVRNKRFTVEECCKNSNGYGPIGKGYAAETIRMPSKRRIYFKCKSCVEWRKEERRREKGDKYKPTKGPVRAPRPTWSSWSAWSKCSVSCMAGYKSRTRSCVRVARSYYDPHAGPNAACFPGRPTELTPCMLQQECPVDGNWGRWARWGRCSVTCGIGIQTRERHCNNPQQRHGGRDCVGSSTGHQPCTKRNCPIHGKWGEWSQFTECTATCGRAVKTRTRKCDSPAPSNGGDRCRGKQRERKRCKKIPCPIDGEWSIWEEWAPCESSCGSGKRFRIRLCRSPAPRHGGKPCQGERSEAQVCQTNIPCPIDGAWSTWSDYGDCIGAPCKTGNRRRDRQCTNPRPQFGGKYCVGLTMELKTCQLPCPTTTTTTTTTTTPVTTPAAKQSLQMLPDCESLSANDTELGVNCVNGTMQQNDTALQNCTGAECATLDRVTPAGIDLDTEVPGEPTDADSATQMTTTAAKDTSTVAPDGVAGSGDGGSGTDKDKDKDVVGGSGSGDGSGGGPGNTARRRLALSISSDGSDINVDQEK